MGMRGRDFLPPMGRRDPMPLPPPLGSSSMRSLGGVSSRSMGSGGSAAGYDAVFSRRSPSRGASNGMSRFGLVFLAAPAAQCELFEKLINF